MKWLALIALVIPADLAEKTYTTYETYNFKARWQAHEMLLEGAPAYSYGTSWTIEVPAPSGKPSFADFRSLSSLAYKFVALNLGSEKSEIEFRQRTVLTSVTLEGVKLYEETLALADIGGVLEPRAWFWGPGRPKARKDLTLRSRTVADFPGPVEETWTLTIVAVSHFDFWTDGQVMFGEVMRQRVKGTVTYGFASP